LKSRPLSAVRLSRIRPTAAAFATLYSSQQILTGYVTNYLVVLGQVWRSAINVADLLQIDDLFQLGKPLAIPSLPMLP